jgi:prephenate dehydratase
MEAATGPRLAGYQGEPGAYSEEAALSLFPGVTASGYRTFSAVFDALGAGLVEVAVLPVENTLGGIVQEANDLLWEREGLRLVREYVHPIRHCLLGRRGDRVERAISHAQALAQTRRYLEARGIEAIPHHDTAGAAREVSERPQRGLAAIASRAAAARYGLDVLAEGIQDDDSNRTRFVVVERGTPARPAGARPGSRTSLCFVAAHEPGSLVTALQCLSTRGVNMTRLEARPIADKPFEYRFFMDFEVGDPATAELALVELERRTRELRLFGTYLTYQILKASSAASTNANAPESAMGITSSG